MKKSTKRLLSLMLSLILVIGLIPGTALAVGPTVVEISQIPSLTVGDTLKEQTLKNAVPSIADTDIFNFHYSVYSGGSTSVTKVKEENKDKNHYANFVWYVSREPEAVVPNPSDYIVKYNGTELPRVASSSEGGDSWYRLYKGSSGAIMCQVYIKLGKPAASQSEHVHTYSENWTRNVLYHWRAATCEHTTEKADYERHTLVDGKCKCGLEHTHDWDTEWSYDDGQHWHDCKAENCPAYLETEKDGWGLHNADAYGNCVTCGKSMFTPSYSVQVVGGNADKTEYAPGETVTITADAPASDKQFKEWTGVDGLTFTSGDKNSATATFTMPAKDVSVTATYEDKIPDKYSVHVVGGNADKTEYAPGETVTITADAPASDKQFAKWTTEDGVTFADATKATTTFVMPAKNVKVDATYEDKIPDKYSVQVVGGTADKTEYAPGETVTITAYEPASGKQFAKWTTEDGVTFADATKATTTFVMPAKEVRVDATYEDKIPEKYKLQVVGGNADKTEYAPGETVTITAYEPASDKQFAKWTTEDGVTFADATKSTTTFVMPAKDVRVDATYEDEVPAGDLDDIPQTGDPMDLVLWGSLAMISAMAAAALIILQKKRVY